MFLQGTSVRTPSVTRAKRPSCNMLRVLVRPRPARTPATLVPERIARHLRASGIVVRAARLCLPRRRPLGEHRDPTGDLAFGGASSLAASFSFRLIAFGLAAMAHLGGRCPWGTAMRGGAAGDRRGGDRDPG